MWGGKILHCAAKYKNIKPHTTNKWFFFYLSRIILKGMVLQCVTWITDPELLGQMSPPTGEATDQSVFTNTADLQCVGILQPSALNHRWQRLRPNNELIKLWSWLYQTAPYCSICAWRQSIWLKTLNISVQENNQNRFIFTRDTPILHSNTRTWTHVPIQQPDTL